MKIKSAKFTRHRLNKDESFFNYDGWVAQEKKPDGELYNTNPEKNPCEAMISLSIGQSVTPRGEVEVKHFKETRYGTVDTIHVSAKNAEDLREKLHALVDAHIGYYYDFTNGV